MAADLQFSLEAQQADIARLAALGERYQRMTGKTAFEALKWMGWRLAGALAASTPKAPKKRKLERNPGDDPEFPVGGFPNYVEYFAGGKPKRHFVKAGDKTSDPWLTIKRAGLAKRSWRWMVGKLGRGGGDVVGVSSAIATVTEFKEFFNPGVVLENKLRYMDTILRRSGKQSVDTAFQRAVGAGEHRMIRFLEGKMRYL